MAAAAKLVEIGDDTEKQQSGDEVACSQFKHILNTNVQSTTKSPTLVANESSLEMVDDGKKVFRFGFGQSPFLPPQQVLDELSVSSHHKEYTSVEGVLKLREAIARFHSCDMDDLEAEDIIVGPGSKILIQQIMQAFDCVTILLVTPSWVSYEPQATLSGHAVIRLSTTFEQRWRLTTEILSDALISRGSNETPLLLILNYPGNPDGLSYTNEELKALTKCFRRYNIIVISDEIYGLVSHHGQHTSLSRYYPEGTIITSGLSKWCGAGGWRLGIALFPKTLMKLKERCITIGSETYSSTSAPIQYAAIKAYATVDGDGAFKTYVHADYIATYLSHMRRVLALIGNYCSTALRAAGVLVHDPTGGFYLNPCFDSLSDVLLNKKGIRTSVELCDALLRDTGVIVLNGHAFGYPLDSLVVRLAYVDFDGAAAMDISVNSGIPLNMPLQVVPHMMQLAPKVCEGIQRIVDWLKEE